MSSTLIWSTEMPACLARSFRTTSPSGLSESDCVSDRDLEAVVGLHQLDLAAAEPVLGQDRADVRRP